MGKMKALGRFVEGMPFLLFFFCLTTSASSAGYDEARVAYGNKNYKEALSQCEAFAETDAKCQNLLAAIHFNGLGVKKNPARAHEYWEKSAAAGYYKAYGNLARQLLLGRGTTMDMDRGNRLAEQAYELAMKEGDSGYVSVIAAWMIKFHRSSKTGDSSLVGKWTERLRESRKP